MFSRKHPDKKGLELPLDWKEKSEISFNKRFEAFQKDYEFHIYGEIHGDEIVLIISGIKRSLELSPISFFISSDIKENQEHSEKLLQTMLDIAELFFEEYFNTNNWSDYHDRWLETEKGGESFLYKITRENVYLSLEANKLLGL